MKATLLCGSFAAAVQNGGGAGGRAPRQEEGAGDGVVLNYLAGTGVRADLKEVRGWQSQGLAFTVEEEQAVESGRRGWGHE